jgi:hypothetical protein
MKNPWQIFAKHYISIISYLLYLAIYAKGFLNELDYERILQLNGGKRPYGEREGGLLQIFSTIIFAITTIVNAIVRPKEQIRFYLCLLALIIAPPVILVFIGF